ncbi:MAG: sigma-70 family RNA polymerase sigma factor, partial [Cyclobacteriaceae bacterium]
LIEGCLNDDKQAQKELYELYKRTLMGICRRYASRKSEAQDIYQEAFIKIFNNIDQVEDPVALPGWMKRVVVTTAITHYHKAYIQYSEDDIADNEVDNNDYQEIMSGMDMKTLLELINNLPDGYRMVFNMHAIDGYKHAEIAEILAISENTSRTQLRKAKTRLKEQLPGLGIKKFEKYV